MPEAVTPPNPADASDRERSVPDPTLLTIDALRREIAMLENLVAVQIEAAESLTKERFHRLDEAMRHFEELRVEQKEDTRAAVGSALNSQQEAVLALRTNFETSISAIQTAIGDLKDRMTTLESARQGASEQRIDQRQVSAGMVAVVGVGIAALIAAMTVVSFVAGGG